MPENKEEEGKEIVQLNAGDIAEVVGYLLTKEYNRAVAIYNQVKDLKIRVILNKEITYMNDLMKKMGMGDNLKTNKIKH